MRAVGWCVAVAVLVLAAGQSAPSQRDAPIMAIVVEPFAYSDPAICVSVWAAEEEVLRRRYAYSSTTNVSGCVWSVYVKWLEMSGIRVLPLRWDLPFADMDYLLDRVNGVLFPGGILQGDPNVTASYFTVVEHIVSRAVNVYQVQRQDGFVVWGTCQGFELIHAALAGTLAVIQSGFVGVDPKMLPVSFLPSPPAPAPGQDRLYHGMPTLLRDALQSRPLTLNWHSKGILPTAYSEYPSLGAVVQPLTTSVDATGRVFVSSVQGVNDTLRIFATQYHPERPPYEFDDDLIGHDPDVYYVSQFLSLKLRKWLGECNHTFENATEADSQLIETFPFVNQGWGIQIYFV